MANFYILCIIAPFFILVNSVSYKDKVELRGSFYYFAYGSNLVEKRLHRSCPSAVRAGIGKLNNYTLDFQGYSKVWHGAGADITPSLGHHLWGAIWKINFTELPKMDKQEYVYYRSAVTVENSYGIAKIYTYIMCDEYKNVSDPLPSKIYLDTIIRGANDSKLPMDYIKYLETIPHNDYDGELDYDIYGFRKM